MGRPLLLCQGVAALCAVCSVFSVPCLHFFLVYHARYERRDELSVEGDSDWDAQARWMKRSFLRLDWPRIISVFA